MSEPQQIFMEDACFAGKLRFGCIQVDNANVLPLDMVNVTRSPGSLGLMLDGATGKPGLFDSAVSIQMFSFPKGRTGFKELVEWFGQDRKARAKLPEGVKFDENVLAICTLPKEWSHEAYAQSARSFVHIYQGQHQAIVMRWMARTGTVLDHPLFKPLIDNLRILPGQWTTDLPKVQPKNSVLSKITSTKISRATKIELEEAADRAKKSLGLTRVRNPQRIAAAVYQAVNELRERKGVKKEEKVQAAIDLGALWGQALCAAAGWEWRFTAPSSGESTHAVCSPNRSHVVDPLEVVFGLLSSRRAENNLLLLFNMIAAGDLPLSAKNSYCPLC
jgi:hypothetical protein